MVAGWPRRYRLSMALLALTTLGLAGCASKVSTRSFVFQAETDVNDRSPIAVEMVLIRDADLIPLVAGLTARSWFEDSDQMERDHPGGFLRQRWELVPGQALPLSLPFPNRRGVAVFVFANYLSPGAHRIRVDDRRRFTLILGREGFSLADRD